MANWDRTDEFTVLMPARNQTAGKQFTARAGTIIKTDYPGVRMWKPSRLSFTGFADFADTLEALQHHARVIIRAGFKDGVDETLETRRLVHDDGSTKANFQPQARRFACMDIDNLVNQWNFQPRNRAESEALVMAIIEEALPPEFHGRPCWYQWSSSMLVADETRDWMLLKIHLWFLLDVAQSDTTMTQWAEMTGTTDESVFRAVQPHYIQLPRFIGMTDPLAGIRSGVVSNVAAGDNGTVPFSFVPVSVEDWETQKVDAIKQHLRAEISRGGALGRLQSALVEQGWDRTSPPMKRIAEIGVGGRLHMPIARSAASWIVHCGVGGDKAAWKAQVRARVYATVHPEQASRASDHYLDAQWRSAERKFQSRHPNAPKVPKELLDNPNLF